MGSTYSFKRDIFDETKAALENSSVCFLLGPRKCGKTVCMKQLNEEFDNAIYFNVKADYNNEAEKRSLVRQIESNIKENKSVVYLIDEVTYLANPDKDIVRIAEAFNETDNKNTKIVFAGSQSKALESWGHIAFASNASYITGDFLNYSEWLRYKDTNEVSEDTYLDFISHTKDFYGEFVSTKDYLSGCLDETVISNNRSVEYVVGNDVGELDTEMLLDVLYASLITLHNHTSYKTFADRNFLAKSIARNFAVEKMGITDEYLSERVAGFLEDRYSHFSNMNVNDCKTALRFLSNCGLITLTYVSDGTDVDPYITSKLLKETNELYQKPGIFSRFNVTINYPMFFVDIVKSILKDKMPNNLPRSLLGSIVECHVRSLLPKTGCYEYRDEKGAEIDYVSTSGKALECSVSNKSNSETHFNAIPNLKQRVLLTKNQKGYSFDNQIIRIPYYEFIYGYSDGIDPTILCQTEPTDTKPGDDTYDKDDDVDTNI